MFKDLYENSLSTTKNEVVQHVNYFSQQLVHYGKEMDKIIEAVKQYPEEVILHLYTTIFYLYGQTAATQEMARQHLRCAFLLLDQANAREVSLYEAAHAWYHQHFAEALKHFERHCYKWPKDLTTLKMTEFLFYCKGQKYEAKRFARLTNYCYPSHQHNSAFLAIHSFALELMEKYEESLQVVQQSLDLNEENPWAHHTLSHLYIHQGLIDEGIDLLEHYAQIWKEFNTLIESHNRWLLALFYLENLDFGKVHDLYRQTQWTQSPLIGEEMDTAALLWRLDLEGQDHTELWKQLALSIGDHANFSSIPFLSTQLCYALKRGQREEALQEALHLIGEFAYQQTKEERFIWQEVGIPLLYGSLAYAEKNYRQALSYFDPIMEKVDCVGGSDAQVDLFYQTYLKSLIGAQRYTEAQSFLLNRTQGRDLTKLERKWLSECQQAA